MESIRGVPDLLKISRENALLGNYSKSVEGFDDVRDTALSVITAFVLVCQYEMNVINDLNDTNAPVAVHRCCLFSLTGTIFPCLFLFFH